MKKQNKIVPIKVDSIEYRIFMIREVRVMLDSDLAELYSVSTGNLNLAVKRNRIRFPPDFMFQLTREEYQNLILQIAISSSDYGGKRKLPYVFTEHGVAMLSAILRSERAVQMSVFIVRAFIKLREAVLNDKDLAHKVAEIELAQEKQGQKINQINNAVVQLLRGPIGPNGPVGFTPKDSRI